MRRKQSKLGTGGCAMTLHVTTTTGKIQVEVDDNRDAVRALCALTKMGYRCVGWEVTK